jgi:amino acid transporter
MAEAYVEERHLLKSLRWWDGFVIALCNPGFLIASLGFSMGALGTWGAVLLWGISAGVGMLQTWIYSETASMFPDKPGGISLYAHEGWRGRFSLAGPIGAFGYWIGWSVVLSIFGRVIGDLIQAQWFPKATWTWFSIGSVHVGLPHIIAIGCIFLVWLLNVFGIRPAVWISYVTGAGLMIPLAIFIVVPYLTVHWHSSNMTWALHGFSGFKLAMVYLFLMGWSAYAAEVCATFAPEYHDTRRDTTIALRSAGMFTLLVFLLFPLGLGGVTGAPTTGAEGQFYVPALAKIVGSGPAGVIIVLLIGSLFLSMISSTADGSRALYGIARDDMTIKQLYHLNRYHVPARAMTVDLVVNVLLVLLISSNLAILYMSNIGYVLAHFLALTGFLLLRRDRPNWPRPIKVGTIWLGIAAVLAVFNAVLIGFGIANPSLTGYGNSTDMYIGVGVLVGSVLLFFFRRLVQDRARITFREQVPDMPSAEQMRLLTEEAAVAAD